MRCLVTGASGFIGSRVITQLLQHGYDVIAIVRDKNKPGRLREQLGNVSLLESPMNDMAKLSSCLQGQEIDACIHLAWYAEPGKYLQAIENLSLVQESLALMRLVVDYGCKRFVGAGTCAEYDPFFGYLREEGPIGPSTIYGASKLSLRYMGEQLAKQLGIGFAWGRVFYVYGPAEDHRRFVSSMINTLLDEKDFLASSGEQVRDFLHVDDLAAAFVSLATTETTGVFNLCSGNPIAMRDLMELIGEMLERTQRVQLGARPKNLFDPPFICGDNSKLKATGWEPKFNLKSGLRDTIDWWMESRLSVNKSC